MSVQKDCADHLRSAFSSAAGSKLRSGHAHELVAAFFGYATAAALQTETRFPAADLRQAEILIPDLGTLDRRVTELRGLPEGFPGGDAIASMLCDFLIATGEFVGEVWQARDLSDHVNGYAQANILEFENELAGEIASTNAAFDELNIDEYAFASSADAMTITLAGSLDGETDRDSIYAGDKILFTSVLTLERVAGRIAYMRPEFETWGGVDREGMYDD